MGGGACLVYFALPNKSFLRLGKTSLDLKTIGRTCVNGSSEMMSNIALSVVSVAYNLQLMRYAHAWDARLTLAGRFDRAELLPPGAYALPADGPVRFSLFAFSPRVEDLCITGAKYPLSGAALTDAFPLGISNERLPGAAAEIRFASGLLLMIRSEDRPTA